MKIDVEQDGCVAAGQCVAAAPDVFDQRDDDGIVVLLEASVTDGAEDDVRRAAASCPAQVIRLSA
jgi:ferredoxin